MRDTLLRCSVLNWLKRAAKPAPNPPPAPSPPEIQELTLTVRALQADLTQIRLEWQETLDKITAWANRAAARDRRAVHKALEAPQTEELPLADHPATPPNPHAAKEELRRRVFSGRN